MNDPPIDVAINVASYPTTEPHVFAELASLRREIELLRRGGCACEVPEWYYASMILAYRCSRCGAVVSPALYQQKEAPPGATSQSS